MNRSQSQFNPRVGMLARVRNRRAIVTAVDPYDSPNGRFHMVNLDYIDADGVPSDTLLWEREINATLLEPNALPQISRTQPMVTGDFDALQRATRWTSLSPFVTPGSEEPPQAIAAPLFGAVQAEDFQLVPLLKALQMPRISLLLADDVGLGKTIEAGLILTELLLRRRIRRVLIISPASLRTQWQQEMKDKFSLSFDVVDRAETFAIQKRLGLDANPWRTYPRIITSYYYLRQPDVLEQFRAACSQPQGSAQLPWDLLIVDEAHNLMPAPFGDDSDLAKMLRTISPWFEHKLFLTATPHNGHTRSFTGMLEQLDPVRFTQTSEFTDASRKRAEEVVVRRLKREINALDKELGRPERFSERIPEPMPLYFSKQERLLARAYQEFRTGVRKAMARADRSEQLAGLFAVEVLNKRLLSSPFTFANSWYRFKEGMKEEEVTTAELNAARKAVDEDLDDDQEAEGRIQHAARTTGAWLKPLAADLEDEMAALDKALDFIGLPAPEENKPVPLPEEDARWDRFLQLVQDRLRDGKQWLPDERLIVFTEYKTTLDYLYRRLIKAFPEKGVIRVLYGGMDDREREDIKQAFNDPNDPVKILVATDAASEGLNLQETARFVLHYDIPFNPSRLDQRNGRLDRHGQARDVIVFHFTSEDDSDLRFLAHVVNKVHTIREELGSMGEVFDAAFERRFIFMEDSDSVLDDLDKAIAARKGKTDIPRGDFGTTGEAEKKALYWLAQEIDLTPETLSDTLERALAFNMGLPRFERVDDKGRVRLTMPLPPQWEPLIDSSVRLSGNGRHGALPNLVFDPAFFIQITNGRPVFRGRADTIMLHLGHPMFHQALTMYARARFPGAGSNATRWTVRYGDVPAGADALLLLTVEELAINDLRETFHHWVRTICIPIVADELGQPLPHLPARDDHPSQQKVAKSAIDQAQKLWDEIELDVKRHLNEVAAALTAAITAQLATTGKNALQEEKERFRHRLREVERAMQENSLQKLEKEYGKIEAEQAELKLQPALLFDAQAQRSQRISEIDRRKADIDAELKRRREHYEELLERLKIEQERVINNLLPRRYQLRGDAQVFPVTIEIRLPEVSR